MTKVSTEEPMVDIASVEYAISVGYCRAQINGVHADIFWEMLDFFKSIVKSPGSSVVGNQSFDLISFVAFEEICKKKGS